MAIVDPRQDIEQVRDLLEQYFDLGSRESDAAMTDWLQQYELLWIHSAILEALYQGRYKVLSIESILRLWGRRGQPLRHYNREFESIISGQRMLFPSPLAVGEPDPQTALRSAPISSHAALAYSPPESASNQANPFMQPPSGPWSTVPTPAADPPLSSAPSVGSQTSPVQAPLPLKAVEAAVPDDQDCAPEASPDSSSIEPFKPLAPLQQKPASWLGSPVDMSAGHPEPIQTFVPEVNSAGLDQRLRAVARKSERSS
jgi:hypothetical protein